mmetsp:Transcript_23097/g.50413  ORF Transcript_23097/g.50413 Transcript_23097/m.50413 type:complete len:274 (-) Transcript_23097:198-1019(-)
MTPWLARSERAVAASAAPLMLSADTPSLISERGLMYLSYDSWAFSPTLALSSSSCFSRSSAAILFSSASFAFKRLSAALRSSSAILFSSASFAFRAKSSSSACFLVSSSSAAATARAAISSRRRAASAASCAVLAASSSACVVVVVAVAAAAVSSVVPLSSSCASADLMASAAICSRPALSLLLGSAKKMASFSSLLSLSFLLTSAKKTGDNCLEAPSLLSSLSLSLADTTTPDDRRGRKKAVDSPAGVRRLPLVLVVVTVVPHFGTTREWFD